MSGLGYVGVHHPAGKMPRDRVLSRVTGGVLPDWIIERRRHIAPRGLTTAIAQREHRPYGRSA